MLQRLHGAWESWRERSRQNAIEAALYKARGGVAPHDLMGVGTESPAEPYKSQGGVSQDLSPFKKGPPPTGPP